MNRLFIPYVGYCNDAIFTFSIFFINRFSSVRIYVIFSIWVTAPYPSIIDVILIICYSVPHMWWRELSWNLFRCLVRIEIFVAESEGHPGGTEGRKGANVVSKMDNKHPVVHIDIEEHIGGSFVLGRMLFFGDQSRFFPRDSDRPRRVRIAEFQITTILYHAR